MRMSLMLNLLFALSAASPALAQSTKVVEGPPLLLWEEYKEKDPTMSGRIIEQIRTQELVAAVQLIRNETGPFNVDALRFSPILLPNGAFKKDETSICTSFWSTDGRYLAEVNYTLAGITQKLGLWSYSTEYGDILRADYDDHTILARSFVAYDCDSRASEFFVPVSTVSVPEKLLVVLEVSDATVKLEMLPIDTKTDGSPPDVLRAFECVPTIRIAHGYDCELDLRGSALERGRYKISMVVTQSGNEPIARSITITLPDMPVLPDK